MAVTADARRIANYQKELLCSLTWEQELMLPRLGELSKKIFVYNSSSGNCFHPTLAEVPWPVQMLLAGYSCKYILVSKAKPYLRGVYEDVNRYVAKVREEMEKEKQLDGVQIAYVEDLRRKLNMRAREAVSATRGRRTWWSNSNYVLSEGMRWIQHRGWKVVKTDKEGNFCLIKEEDLARLVASKLQPPHYEEVDIWEAIRPLNFAVLKRIAQRFPAEEKSKIESTLRHGLHNVPAKLIYTMKTHKNPAELRLIHSASKSPYNGAGALISSVIQPYLDKLGIISASSKQMQDRMKASQINVTDSLKFIKADVQNFYMEGSHETILALAFKGLELQPQRLEILTDLLRFVLDNQFVRNSLDGKVYKITRGSGMGMNVSGAVADKTYYELVERPWITSKRVQMTYGVQFYQRYRDDTIFVVDTSPSLECRLFDGIHRRLKNE